MKEVLSKKFWQDVKKTFDEAKAEPVGENSDKAAPDKPAASPDKPDTQLFEP